MTDERPLHVRVAAALGWTYLSPGEVGWEGEPPAWDERAKIPRRLDQHIGVPDYDTEWSATGPLIERLGIRLGRDPGMREPWDASRLVADAYTSSGRTALEAVCHFLLELDAVGELADLLAKHP